jgi:hypothetical protein
VTDSPEWAAARDRDILGQVRAEVQAVDADEAAFDWLARLRLDAVELPEWWHVVKLGEEAGEAQRAYLKLVGLARLPGGGDELAAELADVVITAYAVAQLRGLDLPAAVALKHGELLTRDLGDLTRRRALCPLCGSRGEPGHVCAPRVDQPRRDTP